MNVIVDTCIWSIALRKKAKEQTRETIELIQLIEQGRVIMLGPIRQEILSGIKNARQFAKLKAHLSNFPDETISSIEYETAAKYFNTCRKNGVQGSNTDLLICAVAVHYNYSIFTADKDFKLYQKHLPIKLHKF